MILCNVHEYMLNILSELENNFSLFLFFVRDTTKVGHVLGKASNQLGYAAPERELTPVSVSLQRLLIHLSMLLATINGNQQVV